MRLRRFMGADFDPTARMVAEAWHEDHGAHAIWQGADELCAHLSHADVGFVAEDEGSGVLGAILVASPLEGDHDQTMRMHWLQQRTRTAAMAAALGIDARADVALLNDEAELMRRTGERLGDAGEVVLLIVSRPSRGRGIGKALLREGLGWLAERHVDTVRLVTDDACDWQAYERLGMERVATQAASGARGLGVYVYQAATEGLLARVS